MNVYGTVGGHRHIRKKRFRNHKPLVFNVRSSLMNLEAFPLIQDFELLMELSKSKETGNRLYYYSQENGIVTRFTVWGHVDRNILQYGHDYIPMGTVDHPYFGGAQGWDLVLFKKRDIVYILEGDDKEINTYKTWYKVHYDVYMDHWNKLIQYIQGSTIEG